jgi:PKHD-type hydroxylase
MSQFDTDPTKFIKFNHNLNNYYYFRAGLSNEDIEKLTKQLYEELSKNQKNATNDQVKETETKESPDVSSKISDKLFEGNVSGVIDKDYRDSRIQWIPNNKEWKWLYDKIGTYAYRANEAMWHFDISFMNEQIQFTEYDESYAGKYDWHVDFGGGSSSMRKISIVIQLSDPADYEGGDLQFYTNKVITDAPKEKGTVICFPSYFLHRVTSVKKGKRRSLVLWVSGAPFR